MSYSSMTHIENEEQYNLVMARIEELLKEPEDNLLAMRELEKFSIMAVGYLENPH
jgi:antitoxin component HigA of HigAB toxin-antitoxin module